MITHLNYQSLWFQVSGNDPDVKELINELGAPIAWNRIGEGNYIGTLAGAFAGIVCPSSISFNNGNDYNITGTLKKIDDDTIRLNTYDGSDGSNYKDIDCYPDVFMPVSFKVVKNTILSSLVEYQPT